MADLNLSNQKTRFATYKLGMMNQKYVFYGQ